ncbi:cytochrome d ubiquinol oxidase subunit II, partial [Francisella tularensis subsp. holarctica]|nr:cytochrome d ubiquinol oxidase subunit II [Francisella tularensis subsp. holarctica]
ELFTKAKQLDKICCIFIAVLMLVIGGMTPMYVKLTLDNLYKMAILIELFVLNIIRFLVLMKVIEAKNHALPYWLEVAIFI